MKQVMFSFLLRIDVLLLRVISLGNCKPGEWISSALWSLELDGKLAGRLFRPCVDFLFGAGHCRDSRLSQHDIYKE